MTQPTHDDEAVAARVPSLPIAEMLAEVLVDHGIPARTVGSDRAYPSVDWAHGVQVRVPADRLDEAQAIIESAPDEPPDGDTGPGASAHDDPGHGPR